MTKNLSNITDHDIQALIDNELEWEHEKRVREAIKYNLQLMKRYNTLKSQKTLIQNWWKMKTN